MTRNAPCPCGSGKRHKHCCGASADAARTPLARELALGAHRAGELSRAEAYYRTALKDNPRDFDSLHMLGVVQMQRLRHREALELLWEAAEQTRWQLPSIRHHLGLVLGRLLTGAANDELIAMQRRFAEWEATRQHRRTHGRPSVSVVMATDDEPALVAQTIASVLAQSYSPVELIVLDDGSAQETVTAIRERVDGAPFPVRIVPREHGGTAASLNAAAQLAQGAFVTFASAGDRYAPERLGRLVDEVANTGGAWGFSLVSGVRDDGRAAAESPDPHRQRQQVALSKGSNSLSLLTQYTPTATGNLFVERELFRALGGFRAYRGDYGWDFCLRAANLAEPVVVRDPLYFYRVDEGNTVEQLRQRVLDDADHVLRDFLARTLTGAVLCPNALAPQWPGSRRLLLREVMGEVAGGGLAALIPPSILRDLAAEWRARPAERQTSRRSLPSATRKTALVVLGMHRSGTSALTRVLNLCGAFLPSKLLLPPFPEFNAKGLWEPVDVVELSERLLQRLGGAWNRVDFPLPADGPLVADFVSDAREVLASAYGDAETILLKDPRICILAPLWHRALVAAGYRPFYVVPVRNPLEVARSLHARGDMSVGEGLALYFAYMKRIADFADAHDDSVYVRYDELLADWRELVRRIARRFGIGLDARARESEVDAFLEPALRHQVSGQAELDALVGGPGGVAVRAVYRDALERCARKAELVPRRAAVR